MELIQDATHKYHFYFSIFSPPFLPWNTTETAPDIHGRFWEPSKGDSNISYIPGGMTGLGPRTSPA